MFVEQMRAAITRAPRETCAELARTVWKAYAAGAIGDDDAQALAEAVEARKAVPATTPAPRRVGSRPRSPESIERRRRWIASGWLPPQIAARFTLAEAAVLAVVAAEVTKPRGCRLTLGHIAALAGVCKTTVRSAIREAQSLGLLVSEEWRLSAFRSAPNHVRIVSPEWLAWLRLTARRPSQGGGSKFPNPRNTTLNNKQELRLGTGLAKENPQNLGQHDAGSKGRRSASGGHHVRITQTGQAGHSNG